MDVVKDLAKGEGRVGQGVHADLNLDSNMLASGEDFRSGSKGLSAFEGRREVKHKACVDGGVTRTKRRRGQAISEA